LDAASLRKDIVGMSIFCHGRGHPAGRSCGSTATKSLGGIELLRREASRSIDTTSDAVPSQGQCQSPNVDEALENARRMVATRGAAHTSE
jgi:hypothetical protein